MALATEPEKKVKYEAEVIRYKSEKEDIKKVSEGFEKQSLTADEALSPQELIAEKYRGIRPAPGYPACPDHSVKTDLFRVLNCAEIGMGLTSSLAMTPAASVSGFYLAHPESAYFNVGKIGDDQLQDWARRSAQDVAVARRGLATLL